MDFQKIKHLIDIDEEFCATYLGINKAWVNLAFWVTYTNKDLEMEIRKHYEKHKIVTGSISERSGTARFYSTPKVNIELDQQYWIGDIPREKRHLLETLDQFPGFFKLLSGHETYSCIFDFFKNEDFVKGFIIYSESKAKEYIPTLNKAFNVECEYANTNAIMNLVSDVLVRGAPADNIIKTGPSSCAEMDINGTIYMGLTKYLRKQNLRIPLHEYEEVSLQDVDLTAVSQHCYASQSHSLDISQVLDEIFPRNGKVTQTDKLSSLLNRAKEISPLSLLHYLFVERRNIPYFAIKEFGRMWFDNVVSFRLLFWPDMVIPWFNRKGRYWPPLEIVEKIKEEGYCYIVPKSPLGHKNQQEWRISFSKAEMILSKQQTKFQRMCYFVAKMILYGRLKDFHWEYVDDKGRKEIIKGEISSYFLKTAMFSLLERTPTEKWECESMESLVGVIKDLFSHLCECLKVKRMKSFFTDEINIMSDMLPELQVRATQETQYIVDEIESTGNVDRLLPLHWNQASSLVKTMLYIAKLILSLMEWTDNQRHMNIANFLDISQSPQLQTNTNLLTTLLAQINAGKEQSVPPPIADDIDLD